MSAAFLAPARQLATKAELAKSFQAEQKQVDATMKAAHKSGNGQEAFDSAEVKEFFGKFNEACKETDLGWTWGAIGAEPHSSLKPVTVAVTGAGTAQGVAVLLRIGSGFIMGPNQPVNLQLLGADASVVKELKDCALPLVSNITAASSADQAFKGADLAILLEGSNADFAAHGKALAKGANTSFVAAVGCTNTLIAASNAKGMAPQQFTAITRMGQEVAETALANAASLKNTTSVSNVVVWGNDVVDYSSAQVDGKWAGAIMENMVNSRQETSPVQNAEAICEHMRDWATGTDGKWVSMGMPTVGDYGMGEGLVYSVPVVCETKFKVKRVGGIPIGQELASAMESNRADLLKEKEAVKAML